MCYPHHFSFSGRAEATSYRNKKQSSLIVQDHQFALTSRSTLRFPKVFGVFASGLCPLRSDGEECRHHPKYTLAMTRRMM